MQKSVNLNSVHNSYHSFIGIFIVVRTAGYPPPHQLWHCPKQLSKTHTWFYHSLLEALNTSLLVLEDKV